MPAYPPPRRYRSDNIGRVLPRSRVDGMLRVLGTLKSKSGPWLDRDPDEAAAWWRDVLNDPRARRSRDENLPENHRDACLRLDRYPASLITVKCSSCGVSAVYTLDDLKASLGSSQSILRLPVYLLPCREKRARREGECNLHVDPGGAPEQVRTVKAMRGT